MPNYQSQSLERLDLLACYRAFVQTPTAPIYKANVLGKLQESILFEMLDKALRVKLVIVNLLEKN